jgi:hypothetical protein
LKEDPPKDPDDGEQFSNRNKNTQFKWALKYFVSGAIVAVATIRLIWFADLLLPTQLVLFVQAYMLVGMLVCEWDKHHAVEMNGEWNFRGWLVQIYWWFWWPYFAWKTVAKRLREWK